MKTPIEPSANPTDKYEGSPSAGSGSGIIFVITAPSGTGKSTLCWAVIKRTAGLAFSVSHTTRPSRSIEREGVDYHFVDDKTFDKMIAEDKFAEWATVYGRRYGTSVNEIERAGREGIDLLIEIDRQGARQIREKIPEAVGIFIIPPSIEALRERLTARGTESPEEIDKRLSIAADEMSDYPLFDYAVINDDFDQTVSKLQSIIMAERCRVMRQEKSLKKIVNSTPQKQAAD